MKKQILFFGLCYYTGLIRLGRWWIRRSGPRLLILNYHRAADGDLRRHMLYLRKHYRILHLEEALDELHTCAEGGQRKQRRDRRSLLALTFDDGYHDNYTDAFPLACELQVPITIFLIPGYIENRRYFWWLEGDYLVKQAQVEQATIDGITYQLERPEEKKALARAIYTKACYARSVAEREAFLETVREALAVHLAVPAGEEVALKWSEIHEMEASGWVSFGGHTMHHPVLGYLADPAEVEQEVHACRTVMEQRLGHTVRTFAYPFGRFEHYGQVGLQAVEKAGYDCAVTTIYGMNTPQSDPRRLQRIACDVGLHWLLIAARISGLAKVVSPLFPYGLAIWATGARIGTWLRRCVQPAYRPRKSAHRWSWSR